MTNGRIYKIIHTQSDICYVGMTSGPLKARWHTHKNKFKTQFKNGEKYNISIYKYFEEFGIDQFKMILIKEYDVIDKNHLKVYETLWINKIKCVNKCVSFNPISYKNLDCKLFYKFNCEKIKNRVNEYHKLNSEKIKEKKKKYYEDNKKEIAEYKKTYGINNKSVISEKKKIKYENNKEMIKCECGSEILKHNYKRHLKKKFHLDFLNKHIEVDIPDNKYRCECGSITSKATKSKHLKSQKHINFLNKDKDINTEVPDNKFRCECGSIMLKTVNKERHLKSQKHLNFISTQNS